jgi:GNAT superfamily N-acetyltransferase
MIEISSEKNEPITVKVITQEAIEDELGQLARLNEMFNEARATPEQIRERLAHPNCAEIPIVAAIDNQIVGFAGLRVVPMVFYEGVHAELTELFVEERHRRRGVGQVLVHFAERLAQEKGAEELILQTDRENQTTREFYRAMGYGEWHIVMGKTLVQRTER